MIIKIRAWDKVNKQYIPHELLEVGVKNLNNKNSQFVYELGTGLSDRNGVEIYAGDIVTVSHGEIDPPVCKIVFDSKYGWQSVTCMGFPFDFKAIDAEVHIVGNINENPEILKPNEK